MTARALGLVLLVVLIASGTSAFAKPEYKAVRLLDKQADAVLTAWRAGDAAELQRIASMPVPDRMRVVITIAFRAKDAGERRAALLAYADRTDEAVARVARAWAEAGDESLQAEIAAAQKLAGPAKAPQHGHPHGAPSLDGFATLPPLRKPSIFAGLAHLTYARALSAARRFDEALERTAAVRRYADEMDWLLLAHQAHFVDGETYQVLRKRGASADAYMRAAAAAARAHNPLLESRALQFVIIMLGRLGRLPDRYDALMRLQVLEPPDATARGALNIELWLAKTEIDLGALDAAEARLKDILRRARAQDLKGPTRKARVLLVSLFGAQGRMDRALSEAEHLLDDPSFQEDDLDRRRALITIASTYHQLGLTARALALCRSVIGEGEAEKIAASPAFGSVLVYVARLLREMGRDAEAQHELERALALYRRHARMTSVGHALGALASVHLDNRRLGEARRIADAYDEITKESGARTRAKARGLRASISLAEKRPRVARTEFEAALRLAGEADARPSEDAWLMAGLGRAQAALGKHHLAATTLKRATVLLLGMASGLGDRHALVLRDRARRVAMDGFAATAAQAATPKSPHIVDDAWWFREAAQALLLAQTIRNTHAAARDAAAPRDRSNEVSALRALAAAQTSLLITQTRDAPDLAELERARKKLEAAHARYEHVAASIDAKSRSEGAAWSRAGPVALDAFQARLAPGDVALAYVVGPKQVHGIAVHRDVAEIIALGESAGLREGVKAWRELASTPNGPAAILGDRLYTQLVRPFARHLQNAKRLVILPDAELAYVPFGALVSKRDEAGDAIRYLLDDFEVAYAPSASVLQALHRRAKKQAAGRGLLALGDPVYPKGSGGGNPAPLLALRDGLARLEPLKASGEEVTRIAALYPEARRRVLLRENATLESWHAALRADDTAPWRAVHLACHGIVDPARPRLSGLVFGGGGILNVEQIHRTHIPADLVVLSACNTAGGALSHGEGVLGLARGFFQAGASRVAMSAWRVADAPTAELMTAFHRHWVKGGAASTALRAARLALRRSNGPYAHPYYWAPFVLWGSLD